MISPESHAENYERESKQKTLTAAQLHKRLSAIIAAGHGARPVFIMKVDGLTHALPIKECFESEPYDGDVVWLI